MEKCDLQNLYEKPSRPWIYFMISFSFLVSAVSIFIMQPIDVYLSEISPYGILDFEFMVNEEQANNIMVAWGLEGISKAIYGTNVDIWFLFAYSLFVSHLNLVIIRWKVSKEQENMKLVYPLVIGVLFPFIAASFDLIENLNLLVVLNNPTQIPSNVPLFATIFATLKFLLLGITILFGIFLLIKCLILALGNKK